MKAQSNATHSPTVAPGAQLTLRPGYPDDAPSLATLAALDSAPVPPSPVLLAEVSGDLWAAVSLATGDLIADPFRPTVDVATILRERANQLAAGPGAPRRRWRAPWPWSLRPRTLS